MVESPPNEAKGDQIVSKRPAF